MMTIDLNKVQDQNIKKSNPLKSSNKRGFFSRGEKRTKVPLTPEQRRKRKIKIAVVILILLVTVGCGALYYVKATGESFGLKIRPEDIFNPIKEDPQLQKDSSGKRTNVMLVGIDTRGPNSGLRNTDTIIVLSYNHDSKDATLISIPRDFYAEIPNENWYVKINGLYNRGEQIEEGNGLEYLKGSVEDVVGLEIQYYAMVDLQGFKKVIDVLGGVEVFVENSFTDYAFPTDNGGIETVSFEQGVQTMDGATALKYVRSRHSNDNGEGSDYARARRQQQLLKGVKAKVLSSETLLDPGKIIELIAAVQDSIKLSEFTNEDIQAAVAIGKQDDLGEIYSFTLDPNIAGGGLIISGLVPGAFSIGPAAGLGQYEDLNGFLADAMASPGLYSEEALISVYDTGLGYNEVYQKTLELQEKYPYHTIVFRGTLFTDKENIYVYENSEDNPSPKTIDTLKKFFSGSTILSSKPDYITNRLNGEDVVILIGAEPASTSENTGTTTAE